MHLYYQLPTQILQGFNQYEGKWSHHVKLCYACSSNEKFIFNSFVMQVVSDE